MAKEVQAEKKVKLSYLVGPMIELPRGALTADEIAQTTEFLSFGINKLTRFPPTPRMERPLWMAA